MCILTWCAARLSMQWCGIIELKINILVDQLYVSKATHVFRSPTAVPTPITKWFIFAFPFGPTIVLYPNLTLEKLCFHVSPFSLLSLSKHIHTEGRERKQKNGRKRAKELSWFPKPKRALWEGPCCFSASGLLTCKMLSFSPKLIR